MFSLVVVGPVVPRIPVSRAVGNQRAAVLAGVVPGLRHMPLRAGVRWATYSGGTPKDLQGTA